MLKEEETGMIWRFLGILFLLVGGINFLSEIKFQIQVDKLGVFKFSLNQTLVISHDQNGEGIKIEPVLFL